MVEGWNKVKLGEVLTVNTGSKNAQDAVKDGAYPFFTRSVETQKIDTYSYETEALFIAGEGNFDVKYYRGKFDVHQRTYLLEAINKDKVDIKFLQNAIQPKVNQLASESVGSTVQSLRKPIIQGIELLIPTEKKEQQKIADILSSADSAIESTSKIISKQKRIKTALMQDLLAHGIDENGKIRSEQTHEYKDSPLGRIPAEWNNTTIGEVCLVRDGTHQTPKYVESGVPFYSVETITNNDFQKVKFISEQEHKELTKNYRIEKDDVLMTRIGSIGDCKYIDWEVDASFYVSLALLKFKDKTLAKYFTFYSNSASFQNEIELHSLPHAIPKKINLGNINDVRLIYPKLETEQHKIAQILSKQDEAIEQEEQKLAKLQRIKTALMQDLLSGKVRVKYE